MLRIDDHHDKFVILPLRTRDVTIKSHGKNTLSKNQSVSTKENCEQNVEFDEMLSLYEEVNRSCILT